MNVEIAERLRYLYNNTSNEELKKYIIGLLNEDNRCVECGGEMIQYEWFNGIDYGMVYDCPNCAEIDKRSMKVFEGEIYSFKMEDINKKVYKFEDDCGGRLAIEPNYSEGYAVDKKDKILLCVEDTDDPLREECMSLTINQAKEVINALQEIVDFVKGE